MMHRRRVVVVGAGVSGLSAAFTCVERGDEVVVLEASARAGGWIGTDALDGFHVERGADGFLAEKSATLALARRLGIEARVCRTRPSNGGASVVRHGRLVPVPEGFSMMAPTLAWPFLRSPLVSWRGKARAALDLVLPRGSGGSDESLGSFVERRFGREVLDVLAQPLAGGIYGAPPETLSLRATMPRFLDEEKRSRSVILGLRRVARASQERAASGARYGLFASFDGGMQVLVDALVNALPKGALRLRSGAESIVVTGTGVRVTTRDDVLVGDALILALPAHHASRLVTGFDALLASKLAAIEHGSAATVALGYTGAALPEPLRGYGFVVPAIERRASIAGTFASRKWPGRAPEGAELIRVFLGGPASPPLDASDEALVACARGELRALLGVEAPPLLAVVHRYPTAMPRYAVGHLDRAAAIEALAAKHPRLRLAGNSLHGVGIPDAIRTGEVAALALAVLRSELLSRYNTVPNVTA